MLSETTPQGSEQRQESLKCKDPSCMVQAVMDHTDQSEQDILDITLPHPLFSRLGGNRSSGPAFKREL